MSEKTVAGQSIRNWNGKPYHSLDYMLKQTFGEKVYRLSLNGGMTCPNRDGTLDSRGCIFCSAGGSGDFATAPSLSVTEQITQAKERIRRKSNCRKELKRRTGRSLDILEVRRHELTAACSPKWAPCRIRYYPGVGRIYVTGPAGQHIGWVDTLADALYELANADTSKVLPGNGLLNGKEPMQ